MDSTKFNTKVAQELGVDENTVVTLLNGFVEIVGEKLADNASIAIPAFGEFLTDDSHKIAFKASANLKKRVSR